MIYELAEQNRNIPEQWWAIGFTCKGKVFADVLVLKSELKFWINMKAGKLDDPKLLARDVSNVGTWGSGDYEIRVSDTTNLEYIMSLVKQALVFWVENIHMSRNLRQLYWTYLLIQDFNHESSDYHEFGSQSSLKIRS